MYVSGPHFTTPESWAHASNSAQATEATITRSVFRIAQENRSSPLLASPAKLSASVLLAPDQTFDSRGVGNQRRRERWIYLFPGLRLDLAVEATEHRTAGHNVVCFVIGLRHSDFACQAIAGTDTRDSVFQRREPVCRAHGRCCGRPQPRRGVACYNCAGVDGGAGVGRVSSLRR